MHLIHLSTARTWRGGEQQIAYLYNGLRKCYTTSELSQQIVCAQGSAMYRYCVQQQLPHTALVKGFTFNVWLAYRLYRIWKQQPTPCIIHAHDPHAHQFAVLAADLFGSPAPIVVSRRVDFAIRRSAYTLHKYQHAQVKKIICVSAAIARIVAQAGLPAERICTIYSGIDTDRFGSPATIARNAQLGSLRQQYQLQASDVLIGSVAALAPHKDLFTFIDTAALVLQQLPHARFVLLGEGELRTALTQYAAQKGLNDRLFFAGFRADLPQLLPQLDLLLMTSQTEGLGTAILDAFVCGVPVVATRAGGIPELVLHHQTGWIAAVKDAPALCQAVVEALTTPHLSNSIVAQARKFAQQFSFENTARQTYHIYQQIATTT